MTQNRLSFAGLQTLLTSENEFNSTGSFNSTGTGGDARRPSIGGDHTPLAHDVHYRQY